MIDLMLQADLEDRSTIHVSPIAPETYKDHIEFDNLGGHLGYFIMRTQRSGEREIFEVLAKAPTFDAASDLFDLIVAAHRR
ncbi:hypothetical protein [Hyphococcus sp.]|uniref:hypothetical protein n=1 Tax=Hyphococcus sp. TaxID=2038636 RepID=UPI00208747C4|nr:MAG: hypothetical protein DHS20C04_31480 [Marinicaulis sp.]